MKRILSVLVLLLLAGTSFGMEGSSRETINNVWTFTHGPTFTSAEPSFTGGLKADTVSEYTSAAGVTVDGVLLKDSAATASGGVVAPSLDRADAGTVTLGGTNATSITVTPMVLTGYGNGAKNGATISAQERTSPVHQTVLTLASTPMAFTDAGTDGYFATKIYDWPEGYIQVLGASMNLACTSAGTFGATGTASFALGTAATADATLNGSEVTIIASTSTGAFVASAGTMKGGPVAAPLEIDGHTTAADLYLNVADAADPGADSVLTCSGTVTVTWVKHGDN